MFRSFCSRLMSPSLLKNVNNIQSLSVKNYVNDRPLIEKGINQVILMGRCGTDASRRGTDTKPVALFSLATHTHYRVHDESAEDNTRLQQKTEWHRIIVFKPRLLEKAMNFAKKGSRLLVQGKISYGEVRDANGNTIQTTSIVADDIVFLASSRLSAEAEPETDTEEEIGA